MDVAIAVVAEDDPAKLSLRAVARDVGVSHAAPKNHFRDKTGLLTAIAIEGFERLLASMTESSAQGGSAIEALARGGSAYIRFSLANPGYFRVMWRNELLDQESEALHQAGQATFDGLMDQVVAAQAEGWGANVPARDLAVMAWASVHGVAQLYLDGPLASMDCRDAESISRGLLVAMVSGFARDESGSVPPDVPGGSAA